LEFLYSPIPNKIIITLKLKNHFYGLATKICIQEYNFAVVYYNSRSTKKLMKLDKSVNHFQIDIE